MEREGNTSYCVYDGHGNVRALTDAKGTITDNYSYDAYGNLLQAEGKTKNDFLYIGEQYNASTGLYYLRARYMNPSTGTFISMDSYQGSIYDPVTLHKYLYANANPVMYTDPTGYVSLGELVTCTSISEVFRHSAGFIALSALKGAIAGAVIGAADSILGGNEWSQVWKDALLGAAGGAGIGILISALACLGVIYPAAITALSIFRGIFLVSGGIATYISCKEGNILQAVFRGLLAIFSYKGMGNLIDETKLFNIYSRSIVFETECGSGASRGAHRTAANKAFLKRLQNDPEFKIAMDEFFGYDVESYMLSGKGGAKNPLNPSKDYDWHHSSYVKGKIQLVPKGTHHDPSLQSAFHPGKNKEGGYASFYGKER